MKTVILVEEAKEVIQVRSVANRSPQSLPTPAGERRDIMYVNTLYIMYI